MKALFLPDSTYTERGRNLEDRIRRILEQECRDLPICEIRDIHAICAGAAVDYVCCRIIENRMPT